MASIKRCGETGRRGDLHGVEGANGYEGVSESTKDKVNAAIEALNYTPNAVAAALSSKQFGRVALLLKLEETVGCVDEINLQYLSGAIHRAKELKLDVVTLFFPW